MGTATDPAGDWMAKREEKGSRLDGREERAAEAKWQRQWRRHTVS